MSSLLIGAFGFPPAFVLTRMIPGTAIGVLVGDLLYTIMAVRLARRTSRDDVTAMPLGLDTPSTFGMVFLILGPAFLAERRGGLEPVPAAQHAWYLGIAVILATGLFKIAVSPVCSRLRRVIPRAGLLGSLAAIGLVLIGFLPLLEVFTAPVPGLVALVIVLTTLTARWSLPRQFPAALAALMIGGLLFYLLRLAGLAPTAEAAPQSWTLRFALPLPLPEWLAWFVRDGWEVLHYLPLAFPLALATVVGGIDCTESAAAAGDDYPTGQIIAAEGLATLVGGYFGGVIQSTPYIGHPAYKAMGGRIGYTLATALFIGFIGVSGSFDLVFSFVPRPVIFPVLIFIGLEITAQSFHATSPPHYPALALSIVPALANLVLIFINPIIAESGTSISRLSHANQLNYQVLTVLGNGFLITGLLWATMLVKLIDGLARSAAVTCLIAAALSLIGVIHSPLPSAPIGLPGDVTRELHVEGLIASASLTPWHVGAAYLGMAAAVLTLVQFGTPPTNHPEGRSGREQGEFSTRKAASASASPTNASGGPA